MTERLKIPYFQPWVEDFLSLTQRMQIDWVNFFSIHQFQNEFTLRPPRSIRVKELQQ